MSQPLVLPVLKRGLKQQLHPQADAQQRLSRRRLPEDRPVHSGAPQLFHRVAEGPHPRQKDVIRPVQFLLVPGDHRLLSDGGQRAFQRKKVSYSIVDHRDHCAPSSPSNRISTARAWAVSPSRRANSPTFR